MLILLLSHLIRAEEFDAPLDNWFYGGGCSFGDHYSHHFTKAKKGIFEMTKHNIYINSIIVKPLNEL